MNIIRTAEAKTGSGVDFSASAFDHGAIVLTATTYIPGLDYMATSFHITAEKARMLANALSECADAIEMVEVAA